MPCLGLRRGAALPLIPHEPLSDMALLPPALDRSRRVDGIPLGQRVLASTLRYAQGQASDFGVRASDWLRTRLRWLVAQALHIAGLLLVLDLVAWPWMRRDLLWDRMSDAPHHLVRIYEVSAALRAGSFFPRWLPALYLGYGYPLLNFYAPGTYYVAALLHALGMTVYASFQWTGLLGVFLGALGTYALAARTGSPSLPIGSPSSGWAVMGSRWAAVPGGGRRDAALLAAFVFTLSPYTANSLLYDRAALPEVVALGLIPWLLLAAHGTWWRGGGWTAALAGCLTLLFLTHNLSTLIGGGVLTLWLAALILLDRRCFRQRILRTTLAILAGAGASAFFWLPALVETRTVHLELASSGILDFHTWLFDPLHRLVSPELHAWATGVAPVDALGQLLTAFAGDSGAVPGVIGTWQVLLWLGLLPLATFYRRRAPLALFWLGLAALCWFGNTVWSTPLWEHVPLLPLVQFPQRFYGIVAIALALASAAVVASLPSRSPAGWSVRGALALCAGAMALTTVLTRPYLVGPEPPHDVDGRDLVAQETNWFGEGTTSGGEFLPRTVSWPPDSAGRLEGLRIYDRAYPEAGWQAGLVRVLDGGAAATAINRGPDWIAAQVEAQTPATLAFHQLAFPGWRAFVDGQPVALVPWETSVPSVPPAQGAVQASLGFMAVPLPAGSHRVEVRFAPTPVRQAGAMLSVATLAGAAAWSLSRRRGASSPHLPEFPARRRGALRAPATVVAAVAGLAAAGCALAGGAIEARPAGALPPQTARVALDVAGMVQRAQAETQAPSGSGAGALPPFLEVRPLAVAGEQRRWLYMHPPSSAAVRLHVPANAYFQAGLALDPQTWLADRGDGVRFILEADARQGHVTLLDQHVNPRADVGQQRWLDTWVSLAPLAGQDVRLILRTDLVEDPTFNWAGWSNPQIVIWNEARPIPGTPHRW